jgi:mannose-6-phosphate isomerase-like protein (cupin superfamily)
MREAMNEPRIVKVDRGGSVEPGKRVSVTLFGDETSSDFLVAWKRLPEGTPPGVYHLHKKAENVLVVLEGTLECIIGGKRYMARENEIIYMPAGIPHATGNGGKGECHAVEFYAPSRGEGTPNDFFEADLPATIEDTESVRG